MFILNTKVWHLSIPHIPKEKKQIASIIKNQHENINLEVEKHSNKPTVQTGAYTIGKKSLAAKNFDQ